MHNPFSHRPDLDDSTLVERLKSGESAAFKQIYLERFEELCNHASTLVPIDDVKDVVQEVLWNVWTTRADLSVQTERELSFYLLRAVRNRALDLLRRKRVRERRAREFIESPEEGTVHEESTVQEHELIPGTLSLSALSISLDSEPDTDTLEGRVQNVIRTLPARSREILILRWYHGLGLEEIASLMGISYGSARVLHTRALAIVKNRLGVR